MIPSGLHDAEHKMDRLDSLGMEVSRFLSGENESEPPVAREPMPLTRSSRKQGVELF